MSKQLALVHTRTTWLHFVGGYYSDTDKFINEAIKSRISRRAPAQTVRGMQFGDRLVLLRYITNSLGNSSYIFAESEIIGITLDHEVAKEVGERLKAEGKAEYHEAGSGGSIVSRECGSYLLCGGWVVTCSLSDVMGIALEIAKQKDETLFVMVNAELTKIYDNPVYLSPSPKFSRGFTKVADETSYFVDEPVLRTADQPQVFAITNYAKA